MKRLNKILMLAVFTLCFVFTASKEIYAASANVAISSGSASTGSQVTITVKITGDEEIAMVDLWLTYDASILEAVSGYDAGGGGSIRLLSTDKTSFTITFNAIAAGSATVSLNSATSIVSSMTTDSLSLTSTQGTITVKAPANYSSNNYLSSLKISPGTLSPAFSKDTTTYYTTVGADCDKLVVSATPEDSKAKVSLSGTSLDPGSNTTYVTVTAEDGTKKTYTIYTTKEGETPTEVVTQGSMEIFLGNTSYNLITDFEEILLPEGYEKTEYQYKDSTIYVGKGIVTNLVLFYLEYINPEDGTVTRDFYVYNETADGFYKYVAIGGNSWLYTIVPFETGVTVPQGYVKTELKIGNDTVDAWVKQGETNVESFLVFAMNPNGEKSWYCCDLNENTIQRAFLTEVQTSQDVTQQETIAQEVPAATDVDGDGAYITKMKLVIGIITALLLIVLIVLVIFVIKYINLLDRYKNHFFEEDERRQIMEDILLDDDEM